MVMDNIQGFSKHDIVIMDVVFMMPQLRTGNLVLLSPLIDAAHFHLINFYPHSPSTQATFNQRSCKKANKETSLKGQLVH